MTTYKLVIFSAVMTLLLSFSAVPSFAALDWDNGAGITWTKDNTGDVASPGKDIVKVGVGTDNVGYIFRMYLLAAPEGTRDAGTIYNVILGASSFPQDYAIESIFKWKYSRTSPGYGFTLVGDSISVTEFSVVNNLGSHYLEWKVDKDQIDSGFYFMGATTDGSGLTTSGHLYDKTEVAATPAPAAAWLLGSGIIGLIGIRRRNQNRAVGETQKLA
jgi:hypothetical protein